LYKGNHQVGGIECRALLVHQTAFMSSKINYYE